MLDIPTPAQYARALTAVLSEKDIELLRTLYAMPGSMATAKDLAAAMGYTSYHAANAHVGRVGQLLADHLGVDLPVYSSKGKERPAYFLMIGEYFAGQGWAMWEALMEALEDLGHVPEEMMMRPVLEPTEVFFADEGNEVDEGSVVQVMVDRFERSQMARRRCLAHHGAKCKACGLDFGLVYGELAEGLIHVHHLRPLASIGKEYFVDPIKDLVPLCPNCHAVVHLLDPPMSIPKLQGLLKKNSR